MLDCQDVIEHLFDYIDKEMDGKNLAEMKMHLELCRSCFDRIEFERVMRIQIQEKTNHCCPERLKNKIRKFIENF